MINDFGEGWGLEQIQLPPMPRGEDASWRPAHRRLAKAWRDADEQTERFGDEDDEDLSWVTLTGELSALADEWYAAEEMVAFQRSHGSPSFTWEEAFILLGLGY